MRILNGPKARRCLNLKARLMESLTIRSSRRRFDRRFWRVNGMKMVFSFSALLLLCQAGFSCSPEQKRSTTSEGSSIFAICPKLETQVREYGDSFVRKDFARLLELTNPKYVEMS